MVGWEPSRYNYYELRLAYPKFRNYYEAVTIHITFNI